MYSSVGGFYDTEIDGSLRFNDDDTAYLSRTPASAGDQDKWTWSGWVKKADINTESYLFSAGTTSTELFYIQMRSNSNGNVITIVWRDGSTTSRTLVTDRVFRDPSAWYHVVLSVDTANATTAHKMRLYINGVEITDFSADSRSTLSASSSLPVNSTDLHTIGRFAFSASGYLDGYLAEVNFIDGTALDPTSFGETKSGVWIPKAYSGSYGTNGFHLEFAGNANDSSGNGNNWTANNITSSDYLLDSPTNNFATLNPLYPASSTATFSDGNLKVATPTSGYGTSVATIVPLSGQYYAEFTAYDALGMVGIRDVSLAATTATAVSGGATNCIGWYSGNGNFYYNGTSVLTAGNTYGSGDVIGVAIDYDAGSVSWYKNGVLEHTQSSLDLTNVAFAIGDFGNSTSATITANFGQQDFTYTPPTDYLALCTANLPVTEAVDPAGDNSPADYFNTVLYTGNGSTNNVTGVGFQPDFVWIKDRSYTYSHVLVDSVRGVAKKLYTNTTSAEVNDSTSLTNFNTDGFTVGSNVGVNKSGDAYVSWNWKAGGSGVSNTDGSITSTVSANTDAGFSIVSFNIQSSGSATVGHGLDSAPDMYIVKRRGSTSAWGVYHKDLTSASYYLSLEGTHAQVNNSTVWNSTAPTSSVFSLGSAWAVVSTTAIAYCFHSVEGFSKFGSYTGNGSTDGTFVYTGFRPAFIMIKRTNSTGNWPINDSARDPENADPHLFLYSNLANAEVSSNTADVDLLSNGFKLRNTTTDQNANGSTYIYMAFAENPFKYANAR